MRSNLLVLLALAACNGGGPGADTDATDTDASDTGNTDTSSPPTLAYGLTAAGDHTCAHTDSGNLHCWGRSHVGQLGLASSDNLGDDELPTDSQVSVGFDTVQVAIGNLHTCALSTEGEVRCWGMGDNGQLGYGNTDEVGLTNTPDSVGTVDLGGTAVEIEAGGMYTCARFDDGSVKCWGQDYGGWLGQGSTVGNIGDNETPAGLGTIDLGGSATRISVGQVHACAILADDSLRCWGEGPATGHGAAATYVGDDETPASAGDPLGEAVEDVWTGPAHTCARLVAGGIRCWGDGMDFELGRPGPTGQEAFGVEEIVTDASQGPVHDFGAEVIDMALGSHYSCALLDTGAVKCWGQHYYGVLGRGEVGSIRVATDAPDVPLGGSAVELAGNVLHNCALLGTEGEVVCWGEGAYGKLGYASAEDVGYTTTPASAGTVSYR